MVHRRPHPLPQPPPPPTRNPLCVHSAAEIADHGRHLAKLFLALGFGDLAGEGAQRCNFPAGVLLASASCSLSPKLKAVFPSFAIFAWYFAVRSLFFFARQGFLLDSLLLRKLW